MKNINEILKILPHRYPFLMVDKILEIEPGKTILAAKNVSINEPHFTGHFPNQPIMPGVLIVEALAQAAGILVAKTLGISKEGRSVYLTGIENAKFRKMVQPGDILHLKVEIKQHRGPLWKFQGQALVEGELVAESSFSAVIQNNIEETI
jgi:3-hydroxyacyl-[acyl-carrier-protein] dehydratase